MSAALHWCWLAACAVARTPHGSVGVTRQMILDYHPCRANPVCLGYGHNTCSVIYTSAISEIQLRFRIRCDSIHNRVAETTNMKSPPRGANAQPLHSHLYHPMKRIPSTLHQLSLASADSQHSGLLSTAYAAVLASVWTLSRVSRHRGSRARHPRHPPPPSLRLPRCAV